MEEIKTYEQAVKLVLIDKTVIVKPVGVKNGAMVAMNDNDKKHDGAFMYTSASSSISLGYSLRERSLKKFLKPDEQRAFEILLQRDPGDLSFIESSNRKCFWHTFVINLDKTDYSLDLNDPMDNLRWRLLLSDPKVCKWEEKENFPEAKWAILDSEANTKQISDLAKIKLEVYSYISDLRSKPGKNNSNIKGALIMLGKRPSDTADLDWLASELMQIADTTRTDVNPNIYDIIRIKNTPTFNEELFLKEAIANGHIRSIKNQYKLKTGEFIANSLEEALLWVQDPTNSTLVKSIEVAINKK
jgi:hypothetical protein